MDKIIRVLTICGSPHLKKSNTLAFSEDFVMEIMKSGLNLEHKTISLAQKTVHPCKGCWNCTRGNPCSINDDLEMIKEEMLNCDLLILASPVYTNQVTAQMKALFDRLFTWCHIFPLLGTYSLSISTTGNDGSKPTGEFLQKMLATYGTMSFGHISAMGGFTSGFFPSKERYIAKYKKTANKIAYVINNQKKLPVSRLQRKMFSTMYKKMSGANNFRYIAESEDKSDVVPSSAKIKFLNKLFSRFGITSEDIQKISKLMKFEYGWWVKRGWLHAKNFGQLRTIDKGIDRQEWLLNTESNNTQ